MVKAAEAFLLLNRALCGCDCAAVDKYTLANLYQLFKVLPDEAKLPSIISVYGSKR